MILEYILPVYGQDTLVHADSVSLRVENSNSARCDICMSDLDRAEIALPPLQSVTVRITARGFLKPPTSTRLRFVRQKSGKSRRHCPEVPPPFTRHYSAERLPLDMGFLIYLAKSK